MISEELYQQIVRVMPIPCVDLMVVNDQGEVLLAKRKNEPAKDEWWFPGGRVHYLENRRAAAIRKLREECGLETDRVIELGTFDVIVERQDDHELLHGITTLFSVQINPGEEVLLDDQNSKAEWRLPSEWMKLELNMFIRLALEVLNLPKTKFC
jgi:colanic acid biosynthesis protein WcaH